MITDFDGLLNGGTTTGSVVCFTDSVVPYSYQK